ncbi:MAG: type III pantothenate kinase [Bacteroidetes bacterium]|nr:type III pantothenate kinase [Bacteroidota bacterium]
MFLALDIGNSATKLGLHDGSAWIRIERLSQDGEDRPGQFLATSHLKERELGSEVMALLRDVSAEAAGIASVVPDLTVRASEAIREQFGIDPVVVSTELPLPFEWATRRPRRLAPTGSRLPLPPGFTLGEVRIAP